MFKRFCQRLVCCNCKKFRYSMKSLLAPFNPGIVPSPFPLIHPVRLSGCTVQYTAVNEDCRFCWQSLVFLLITNKNVKIMPEIFPRVIRCIILYDISKFHVICAIWSKKRFN